MSDWQAEETNDSTRNSVLGLSDLRSDIPEEPVELWLFHGDGKTSSFSLRRSTLLWGASLFCFLVLFAISATVYECWAWYSSSDIRTLSELKDYLQKRKVDDADSRMKLLADEFARVHRYEQQIKTKLAALDGVIKDALDIDTISPDSGSRIKTELKKDRATRSRSRRFYYRDRNNIIRNNDNEDGIGGGESAHAHASSLNNIAQRIFGRSDGSENSDVNHLLDLQLERLASIPIGIPVLGRPSSTFGFRWMPGSGSQHHEGVDYAINQRTPVYSTADGLVVHSGWHGAYGLLVIVDHGNGVETAYGHLSRSRVKAGDRVCRGQQIGNVGSTGRSTGPHVHYEVRVGGVPKDPERFVQLAGLLRRSALF